MDIWSEIRLYLPKYLSDTKVKGLIEELKQFPENIDSRIFTNSNSNPNLLQGDGIQDALIVNLPKNESKHGAAMILSNSCDIDLSNERFHDARVLYAPLAPLRKYEELLRQKGFKSEQIESHFLALKKQYITQMFYLPKGGKLEHEYIAFFDFIVSIPLSQFSLTETTRQKFFRLSDYGFYIFLFKLSIHFTRIQEAVIRS